MASTIFDQLRKNDPILAIFDMAPAFITAVVPPAMRRRKCQAESTHATERKYNQKLVHCYAVERNR